MKKVWVRIKFELVYMASEMWSHVNEYVFKHNKRFNRTIRKFIWNVHMHWFERSLALYNEMEELD